MLEVLGRAGESKQQTVASIKRVISAGAPATLSSINRFSKMLSNGAEVINSYGATESLPISKIGSKQLLTTTNITDQGGGICVGSAIDNVDISIIKITEEVISQWDNTLTLPCFEIGEIVVKGPQVSAAYYHRDQATAIAKIADGEEIRHRMGDLGYLDDQGKLWMCGRKAHQVLSNHLATPKSYYSIPCERIFNVHKDLKRSALVSLTVKNKITPAICIELNSNSLTQQANLFDELTEIAKQHPQTQGITLFYIHKGFPMDIRHNAKIFREKLAIWAQNQQ